MRLSRREFLKSGLTFLMGLQLTRHLYAATEKADFGLHEARHYTKISDETVKCQLCPISCVLNDTQRSYCRVRECRGGRLYTLVYESVCALHVDPIEKKPVFHMLPGSKSLSIATAGCNSRCKFCQNWQISQAAPEETSNQKITCEEVVSKSLSSGCKSIAYTYSEPTVFYEYMIDTAKLARAKGIKNIWVTGGFINEPPLRELSQYVEAANIDLKGFDDDYLRNVCGQNLKTITHTIRVSKECGMWIELTNLIVPTLNDDLKKIEKMALWIKEEIGKDVPLHFSRFWPMYKLKNLPPTPVSTLEKARKIALDVGLEYVYIGNVPGHEGNNTYCPSCKKLIIEREGYLVKALNMADSRCKFCGREIAGIWH